MSDTIEIAQPEILVSSQQPNDDKQQDILKVAKGGGISFIGWALGVVATYFYNFFLARAIGAESFGLLTLGITIVSVPTILAVLGLGRGIVRFGAIYARDGEKAKLSDIVVKSFSISLVVSIITALGLFALAPWLSNDVFHTPYLTSVLALLTLIIPLVAARSIFLAATQAFKVTWMVILVHKLFLPICALTLSIALIALNLALRGVVIAYVVSSLLSTFLAYYLLRRLLPAPFTMKREPGVSTATLLRFSLPLVVVSLLHYTYARTETIFLGLMNNAASVGIYDIVLRMAGFETVVLESLSIIFSPFISDLYERKALADLEDLYKTTAQWSFTAGLALFMIFMIFSEPVMGIWGNDFRRGATALAMLGFAQLVNTAMGQAGYVLMMTGRSTLILVNTIAFLVSSAILDVILIPRYDLLGAAIAGSVAILSFSVLRMVEVYYILKIHPFKWAFWKPAFAGLVAMSATYALRLVSSAERDILALFVLSPVCLLFFTLLIYKLGLENEDRVVLLAIQRKLNEFLPLSINVVR